MPLASSSWLVINVRSLDADLSQSTVGAEILTVLGEFSRDFWSICEPGYDEAQHIEDTVESVLRSLTV